MAEKGGHVTEQDELLEHLTIYSNLLLAPSAKDQDDAPDPWSWDAIEVSQRPPEEDSRGP